MVQAVQGRGRAGGADTKVDSKGPGRAGSRRQGRAEAAAPYPSLTLPSWLTEATRSYLLLLPSAGTGMLSCIGEAKGKKSHWFFFSFTRMRLLRDREGGRGGEHRQRRSPLAGSLAQSGSRQPPSLPHLPPPPLSPPPSVSCLQVEALDREVDDAGVLLPEEVVLVEPAHVQHEVVGQAGQPVAPAAQPDVVVQCLAVEL